MKRVFTSKQQRKQAEDTIIRNMRQILFDLKQYKKKTNDPIDKKQVMSVLTRFIELKKSSRLD